MLRRGLATQYCNVDLDRTLTGVTDFCRNDHTIVLLFLSFRCETFFYIHFYVSRTFMIFIFFIQIFLHLCSTWFFQHVALNLFTCGNAIFSVLSFVARFFFILILLLSVFVNCFTVGSNFRW